MARVQFDNPEQQKLIGVCGKLKCCLKYEYSDYLDAMKTLPEIGSRVNSSKGDGTVVTRNLTLRTVTIQIANGERVGIPLNELRT